MIVFLLSVALAQEPQSFDPLPTDVILEGKSYSGILVDEATYIELGRLRVETKAQAAELETYEEWRAKQSEVFKFTMDELKVVCDEGMTTMQTHYDTALLESDKRVEEVGKRTFIEKHGFEMGVALGVVGATVLYLGSSYFYGQVLEVSVQ